MSKPGRRIDIETVREDVSRDRWVRPGLGIHPHADRFRHRGGRRNSCDRGRADVDRDRITAALAWPGSATVQVTVLVAKVRRRFACHVLGLRGCARCSDIRCQRRRSVRRSAGVVVAKSVCRRTSLWVCRADCSARSPSSVSTVNHLRRSVGSTSRRTKRFRSRRVTRCVVPAGLSSTRSPRSDMPSR